MLPIFDGGQQFDVSKRWQGLDFDGTHSKQNRNPLPSSPILFIRGVGHCETVGNQSGRTFVGMPTPCYLVKMASKRKAMEKMHKADEFSQKESM
jgi:hypothetical protein